MTTSRSAPRASAPVQQLHEASLPLWLLLSGLLLFGAVCCVAGALLWQAADDGGMAALLDVRYHEDEHAAPPLRQARLPAWRLVQLLGRRRARLFARLDRDWNGLLSLAEMAPLLQQVRLNGRHPVVRYRRWLRRGAPCRDARRCVGVDYAFQLDVVSCRFLPSPSQLAARNGSAMAALSAETQRVVAMLRRGAPAVHATAHLDWTVFGVLAPPASELRAGQLFDVLPDVDAVKEVFLGRERRAPGYLWGERERELHLLLHRLHLRLFVAPRAAGVRAAGVVRAVSRHLVDVLVRLHVELQINERANETVLWLAPAALEARLVVPRGGGPPLLFELAPALDEPAVGHNALLDWPSETGALGLGSCRLAVSARLAAGAANVAALRDVAWTDVVAPDAALRQLRGYMLPHRAVPWQAGAKACTVAAAAQPGRPVHLLLGVGSLLGQALSAEARLLRNLVLEHPPNVLKYDFVNCWLNGAEPALSHDDVNNDAVQLDGLARREARLPLTALVLAARSGRALRVIDRFDAARRLRDVQDDSLTPVQQRAAVDAFRQEYLEFLVQSQS